MTEFDGFEVIAHTPGCSGGNCPTIWRNPTTGRVRLRGYDSTDRSVERDIEYSADEWAYLAAQLA